MSRWLEVALGPEHLPQMFSGDSSGIYLLLHEELALVQCFMIYKMLLYGLF